MKTEKRTNNNSKEQVIEEKFERLKEEIILLIKEDFAEDGKRKINNKIKDGTEDESEQKEWIYKLVSKFSNNDDREYTKRNFKIIGKERGKTLVRCSFPLCESELKSGGTGWHWKKHTRLAEKLGFSIMSDKMAIICQKCSKETSMFDIFNHLKSQHYQELQIK